MKRSLFALLVVSLLSCGASAQDAGQAQQAGELTMALTGAVYDANGSVIVNEVKIVAHGTGGKVFRASVNSEGIYTLRLPLGIYSVEAGAPHFCKSIVDGFRIVNATHGKMALDFVLDVAPSHAPCAASKLTTDKKSGDENRKSEKIVE
ncbi:MAG TPA: carboxypeptidase-like regulatory domain-containing protein [Pyrinomonadaceae bacterium]